MTLPSLLFGILISTVIGTGYHLVRGGSFGRIFLDIIFSWIGFWGGHLAAIQLDWPFWSVGPLHLGMAVVGSIVILILGSWITTKKIKI
jgi:uncharacterized membrane protein YeaQ/YmgE (transglycosylase-associated protein family)